MLYVVWWVGLGVLSSIGLGTGMHSGLLFLFPHILMVCALPVMLQQRAGSGRLEACAGQPGLQIMLLGLMQSPRCLWPHLVTLKPPFSWQVCLAAERCGNLDFDVRADIWWRSDGFHCARPAPGSNGSSGSSGEGSGADAASAAAALAAAAAVGFWPIFKKVIATAVLWGAGTALGEIPPYAIAYHAAKAGERNAEVNKGSREGGAGLKAAGCCGYCIAADSWSDPSHAMWQTLACALQSAASSAVLWLLLSQYRALL